MAGGKGKKRARSPPSSECEDSDDAFFSGAYDTEESSEDMWFHFHGSKEENLERVRKHH